MSLITEFDITSITACKEQIRSSLSQAATNFVEVGFVLKLIRDKELYRQDGFENLNDFASAEFGIDKTAVNYYMRINDEFSVGGNSAVLEPRYRSFEKGKLREMLTLPEKERNKVTPDMTVKQIRELKPKKKKEVKQVDTVAMSQEVVKNDDVVETSQEIVKKDDVVATSQEVVKKDDIVATTRDVASKVNEVITDKDNTKSFADAEVKESDILDENAGCPPNMKDCPRKEWGFTKEEQERGRQECEQCWDKWKRQPKKKKYDAEYFLKEYEYRLSLIKDPKTPEIVAARTKAVVKGLKLLVEKERLGR